MTRITTRTSQRWPGFHQARQDAFLRHALMPAGNAFRKQLGDDFFITDDRGIVLGPPQFVRRGPAAELRRFVRAYERCLQRVVAASKHDGQVNEVLSLPDHFRRDLGPEDDPLDARIHLFRLDLLLDPDGGFQVLENNANCPGGILYTGEAARAWRAFLAEAGDGDGAPPALPPPLPHEDPAWMARWFMDAAQADLAGRPDGLVALLRQDGGNRIELREYAESFAALGVEAVEADPRELRDPGNGGPPTLHGRPVRHAYLKLGMQPYLRMRPELDVMVRAIHERRLFVQNGLRARWVGDSKLCLAVLSDPRFAYLFDPADLEIVAPHMPWSRNAALVDDDRLADVRADPPTYVLKSGWDTRGRGVVVGRETADLVEWNAAVDAARDQGWLVQTFCETTRTRADFDTPVMHRHDLAVAIVSGDIGAMFMRSSGEYKVNVAQNGRLHPVFVEA